MLNDNNHVVNRVDSIKFWNSRFRPLEFCEFFWIRFHMSCTLAVILTNNFLWNSSMKFNQLLIGEWFVMYPWQKYVMFFWSIYEKKKNTSWNPCITSLINRREFERKQPNSGTDILFQMGKKSLELSVKGGSAFEIQKKNSPIHNTYHFEALILFNFSCDFGHMFVSPIILVPAISTNQNTNEWSNPQRYDYLKNIIMFVLISSKKFGNYTTIGFPFSRFV